MILAEMSAAPLLELVDGVEVTVVQLLKVELVPQQNSAPVLDPCARIEPLIVAEVDAIEVGCVVTADGFVASVLNFKILAK